LVPWPESNQHSLWSHRELPQQPGTHRSKNTKFEFNIEKANQILGAAGWKKGGDGICTKDGKPPKFVAGEGQHRHRRLSLIRQKARSMRAFRIANAA
jgi:ABC-type transport system substrate-binding protein